MRKKGWLSSTKIVFLYINILWKKPVIDLSIATPEDRKYESAVLQDVQFRSPYTVVKFNGSSLDQSKVTEQGTDISKWKL